MSDRRPHRPGDEPPEAEDGGHVGGSDLLRPYVITGGRTRSSQADELSIEAIVMINPASSPSRLGRLEFERRRIVELCAEPTSIGELAGQIDVPLGVAMVLASDLVSEGVLVCNDQIDGTNVELIERLIEGIRSQ